MCWPAHNRLAWSWSLVMVLLLPPWGSMRVQGYRLQGGRGGFQGFGPWSRLWPHYPGVQSLEECVSCCCVHRAGLCGGPTSPGIWSHSRALGERGPGVLPMEAKEFCTLPLARLRGKIHFSLLSSPIPHFPIPSEEPGLPESNSWEWRGWPVYIQPHRSGDGELREDNLILKISFIWKVCFKGKQI